mmetsp:Transcript_22007/g.63135  ORF Transcript_22007/g.63135 Transcript_22007/m.63135 type:complete len:168 (+) Transcript_22007:49-552(+)
MDSDEPPPPPPPPPPLPANDDRAARAELVRKGFRINYMNMRDASTGQVLWEHHDWDCISEETEAHIPRAILSCPQVSREINFSSQEQMSSLRLVQTIHFNGQHLEEWQFSFGFVIPNSTNTWQQTIEAADADQMIPAELLSGNTLIDTTFFDGDVPIASQRIRIWYV